MAVADLAGSAAAAAGSGADANNSCLEFTFNFLYNQKPTNQLKENI
jgi:hypothetical protein